MSAQLTREQKLMAEQVVQLGNIVEQLNIIADGGRDNSQMLAQIEALQAELAEDRAAKAALVADLQESEQKIADLTAALAEASSDHTVTPDDINEVMNHLGIEFE